MRHERRSQTNERIFRGNGGQGRGNCLPHLQSMLLLKKHDKINESNIAGDTDEKMGL